MVSNKFELIDKKILNIVQSDFPLVSQPFEDIGLKLGITENEAMLRVNDLKNRNIIRQISAIFDTRRLGYSTSLVAMRFNSEHLESGAQIINRHPGVSHNYGREGHFNLWFTIAVPPGESINETVSKMGAQTHAISWRLLPTKRFFKIGVNFDMESGRTNASHYFVPDSPHGKKIDQDWNKAQSLTSTDIEFVRQMQKDLKTICRPFDPISTHLNMTNNELFKYAVQMMERKLMRRFSAVLHHRRAGFSANAMVVWKVPPERAEEVGQIMAKSPHVTHCYERPTYNDWPFSHYTMVHAKTREECETIARDISDATSISEHQLVFSTREYKKTRVNYFV